MHTTTSQLLTATVVRFALAVVAAVMVVMVGAGTAHAAADVAGYADAEAVLVANVNAERATVGLAALTVDSQLVSVARAWTMKMSVAATLAHNPNFGTEILGGWTRVGENVGNNWKTGADVAELVDRVHAGFMASPLHRDNVLGEWTRIGVGITVNPTDGKLWVTVNFSDDTTPMQTVAAAPTADVAAPQGSVKQDRTTRLHRTRR